MVESSLTVRESSRILEKVSMIDNVFVPLYHSVE